jgi:hypothetical protein
LGKPFLFWWKMEVSCIFSLLTNPMNIGNIMEYIYIYIYIYTYIHIQPTIWYLDASKHGSPPRMQMH